MSVSIQSEEIESLVAALVGGIDIDGGPTDEQLAVLGSIVSDLWQRPDLGLDDVSPLNPADTAKVLPRPEARLRFCEILMTLELCRHPQSEKQVEQVEAYVSALGVNDIEIQTTREALEREQTRRRRISNASMAGSFRRSRRSLSGTSTSD